MSDLSKSVGNANRYSFWCDAHQQRRFYGVCLWLMDAYDNKRIKPDESHPQGDCATAMCRGNCTAKSMRSEEITAGKSIYFQEAKIRTERIVRKDELENDESYLRGWNQVGRSLNKSEKRVEKPSPMKVDIKKPSQELKVGEMDMAAIITSEVKRETDLQALKREIVFKKKEVVALAKTNPARARELLAEVKKLESQVA